MRLFLHELTCTTYS